MCLILFAKDIHPKYKLIIAANRDEFYQRPTKSAHFWEEDGSIIAGKDMEAGGTWMGMTKSGRISMLTNYRDLSNIKTDAPSRGHLVSDFLKNGLESEKYLSQIASNGEDYNGFNLISGTVDKLHYYGNYQNGVHEIKNGTHGLSNALLNTNWPKVEKGKAQLSEVISRISFETDELFEILRNDIKAADEKLPNTGVGYEKEKMLSPMFIKSENYGSRCSTVITVDSDNEVFFSERTYDTNNFSYNTVQFEWQI